MSRRSQDDGLLLFIGLLVIAIAAMPVVGFITFVKAKDDGSRLLGIALMVIGCIIWVMNGGN